MTRRKPTEAEYQAALHAKAQDIARNLSCAPTSELAATKQFVAWDRDRIAYVEKVGFLVWDDARWALDPERVRIRKRISEYVEALIIAASEDDKADARLRLRYASAKSIGAILSLASSHVPHVPKLSINKRPMLFNVQNGTIDLTTGELRDFLRNDWLTKLAPVTFDSTADCPYWRAAVKAMCRDRNGDERPEFERLIQRVVGYCLTGSNDEKVSFFLTGPGDTGKSTFATLLLDLFGAEEYATVASSDAFMKRGRGPNSEGRIVRSECEDIRVVTSSEVSAGSELDEEVFKSSQGGDMVRARGIYARANKYVPEFKLVFLTNTLPKVNWNDKPAQDRIFIIPLEHEFKGSERVQPHVLRGRFREELSGILNWAIQGCLEWQRVGLATHLVPAIAQAKAYYLRSIDPVGKALMARYELAPTNGDGKRDQSWEAATGLLHEDHEQECAVQDLPVSGVRDVAEWLKDQGCVDDFAGTSDARYRVWRGIRRRPDAPEVKVNAGT